MGSDSIKLFSSIKPALMRAYLVRGTFIAMLGLLLLVYGGTFLDVHSLTIWGIPILFVGSGLIAYGLIPYRRLCRFEKNPSELIVDESGFVQFIEGGKLVYSIPLENIEHLDYYEKGNNYGICVTLKDKAEQKVIVHQSRFNASQYQRHCRKIYDCDLFIPYFGRRAFTRLAFYTD